MDKNTTNEEWKQKLSEKEYHVLREKGTEAPYSGEYDLFFEDGAYKCAACGAELFDSGTKFDAQCGWPSFYDAKAGSVEFNEDNSLGVKRTEVTCANCGGHLGHIFPDAPEQPTGNRFCINSIALKFTPKK